MRYDAKKVLGSLLNIFAIACLCYIAWTIGTHYFASKTQKALLHVESQFPMKGIKWDAPSNGTLVMALSTTCTFCRQSVSFYQQLVAASHPEKTHIVAIFGEPAERVRAYLTSEHLTDLADVRQADFASLGLSATPTLILVDRNGVVKQVWTGLQPHEGQDDIRRAIGVTEKGESYDASSNLPDSKTAATLLKKELAANPNILLVDVRDRTEFAMGHLAGAENIPADEMEIRASH